MGREHLELYGSDCLPDEQTRVLRAGEVPVAVYGLGKMDLPLVAVYVHATGNVTGVDTSEGVVGGTNDDECHVAEEPGLPELIVEQAERGMLRTTTDGVAAAEGAAVHVIIVPASLTNDREPDLTAFEAILDNITWGLAPGDLIVIECAVLSGTSKDLVIPHLVDRSGLSTGEFGVAFCPERVSSGQALRDITESHPKIAGRIDAENIHMAVFVYGEITANEVIPARDATIVKAVKLFEGAYRDASIMFANELTRLRDDLDIDVTKAIDAANTQPYCDIHAPGPNASGHYISRYSYSITGRVAAEAPLLLTAREVNDSIPVFIVDKLRNELATAGRGIRGATVVILDVIYRLGIAETRTTPAAGVIDRLNDLGATVLAVDLMFSNEIVTSSDATSVSLPDLPNRVIDAAAAVTPREEFDGIG